MKIIIPFLFLTNFVNAQATFVGDSILVNWPTTGAVDYSVQVQNADNLSESVYFWSDTGQGTYFSPFCNVRVSVTCFDSSLVAMGTGFMELERKQIVFEVASMPNRKALLTLDGGDFEVSVRHIAYGGNYIFYEGFSQYTSGAFGPGHHTIFIPYRTKGMQVVSAYVNAGVCSGVVSKAFYLN